ncbi:MAG TPA: hypothetical protein VG412_13225, partial [Acidimicrobiales bacterium]|nr:hypothetical protein [Acidimicrobiales bacterium]
TPAMNNEVGSLAFALSDINNAKKDSPPLSVLVGPPGDRSDKVFVRSMRIFEQLNADVIEDSQDSLRSWGERILDKAF